MYINKTKNDEDELIYTCHYKCLHTIQTISKIVVAVLPMKKDNDDELCEQLNDSIVQLNLVKVYLVL